MTEEKILREGPRLLLRKAEPDDLDYILELEYDKENRQFIVPFDESFHRPTIAGRTPGAMDVIAVEKQTGERVGYFLLNGLMEQPSDEIASAVEWTHIIIARKGKGYGHEALKLLKALAFEKLGCHRAWLDCKTYNARALHLYESEGLIREALEREVIRNAEGSYEDLVVLSILDHEYAARKAQGLELGTENSAE